MMQLAHGMVGLRRRGVAAVVLAAGLLGMAAPVFAQVTAPGAPVGLVAVAGDLKVTLNWKEPDSDGGAPITGYEYRYKSMGNSYPAGWTAVPDDALGVGASLGAYLIQPNLMNGTAYTFQVRAVNSEGGGTPSDEATATPQPNIPAMYESFSIKRVPRVPATLDMELGTFQDMDGLSIANDRDERYTYQWQWIRVTGGSETEIPGAVSSGAGDLGATAADDYTLTPADVGSQLKVRARFLDDRSNQEEWVSPLFPSSGTILPAATCPAPRYTGDATQIWSEEIRIDTPGSDWYGVRSNATFTAGSTYTIDLIVRATAGSQAGNLIFSLTSALTAMDKNQLTLHVCDEAYPFIDATFETQDNDYAWPSTATWSDLVTRTISLSRDAVAPTVTGATLDGTALIITFSEDLDSASTPAPGDFTVTVAGNAVDVDQVSVGGFMVTLTLAAAVQAGQTVTLDYAPGDNPIQDGVGNAAVAFSRQVTNGGGQPGGGGPTEPEPLEVEIVGVPDVAVAGESYELTAQSDEESLVYAWRVAGGTIEPDDARMVVWTAPATASVAWIHVDVTREDGATAGQSAYVRVEVPEPEPEPEPVPALPLLGQLLLALGLAGAGARFTHRRQR